MGIYKQKQFMARMKLSTYRKLRDCFPSNKNESAAHYFERLADYLDAVQAEWSGFKK